MTLFASVAVFQRDGKIRFKPPRKEPNNDKTQARKSAVRYWRGNIAEPDVLSKVILVQASGPLILVSERAARGRRDKPWVDYHLYHAEAAKQAHIAACLTELGVDPEAVPPPLPETLEINGVVYRREI
jgi:hypothetical protein